MQDTYKCEENRGVMDPYLDTFLIINSADHPHAHLSDLTKGWLLQTDVSEDLDHPFSYTDTSVLQIHTKINFYTLCNFYNHKN